MPAFGNSEHHNFKIGRKKKIDVIGPNVSVTYYQPVNAKRVFVNGLQPLNEYAFNATLIYSFPQAGSGRFSLHLFSWTVATQHAYNGKKSYLIEGFAKVFSQ